MASTSGDSMAAADIEYISLDLIFRILLWLPVASLLRFKSLCKCWYSLIQSPEFVYQHHHFTNSIEEDPHRFISLTWPDDFNHQQISVVSVNNSSKEASSELLDLPTIEGPYHFNEVRMVASCNGIICLQQDYRVCLWNPATKQSTNLPSMPVMPLGCTIGFGFDVKTNDYKVLCMDTIKVNPTAHLYSLISDSWTSIPTAPVSSHVRIQWQLKTTYNNRFSCFWFDESKMILSFDFRDEVFGTILLPEDSTLQDPFGLFILRENIAFVNKVSNAAGVCYEIWMLNDYNLKDSWTKLYSISSSLTDFDDVDIYWMTGFSKNGDFLLLPMMETCFLNLVTHEVIDLSVHVSNASQCLPYEESLVSVKRGNRATNIFDSEFQHRGGMMLINQPVIGSNSWADTDIPEVVLFHILLLLPVVSLLRFKSVCKSWCDRIKSSYFAAQYLHHHHHENGNDNISLILHSCNPYGVPLFEDSLHPSRSTSCTCLLSANNFELLDLPYSESWEEDELIIVSSFDGIICLRLWYDCNVYLWNPATKQFKVVLEELDRFGYGENFCIGFGFDVNTNDYKLVRFHRDVGSNIEEVVQVYSLNTDSWRSIDDEILSTVEVIDNGLQAPCRKGIYCWIALINCMTYSYTIVSFDFGQEVFKTMQLPYNIQKSSSEHLELTVLRDNIGCIITYFSEVESWHCVIWAMSEFGVEESWTKLYTVGPFSSNWGMQIGYSKKNRDYVLLKKDGQLYTHDLVTQGTRRIPVKVQGPENYQVVLYKESLVPIN